MKRILYFFCLVTCHVNAQHNFVVALSSDGPQNGGALFKLDLPGNTTSLIHAFNNLDPHRAESGLTMGDDDWLYGTLRYNGTNNNGALYRIKNDGTGFAVLYQMTNSFGPTTRPYFHTDGNIYFSDETELLKYDPNSNAVNVLSSVSSIYVRNFNIDSDDWIYFVTSFGSLEKIKTDGSSETTLRNFTQNSDGFNGVAGVTEIPGDSLIGVLTDGGALSGGIIYSVKKDGTGFTVLHSFQGNITFNPEGYSPESKLIYYDGRLFGTTSRGGNEAYGVVYSINTDGTGYHVVAQISAGSTGRADQPIGDISITSDGKIIGAFYQFAQFSNGNCRFFSVDTSGLNFQGFGPVDQHQSGHFNMSPLLLDDQTILFTTQTMGKHDGGAMSEVSSFISSFSLFNFGASATGFRPGGLIKASDGLLYGITNFGGLDGGGTVYSMMPDGSGYTKLHEFDDAQGYEPTGKLLEGSDGKLYGALAWGGPSGAGCLYRLDKNGNNFQVIYSFPNLANGYSPTGNLLEDGSGVLYGTTVYSFPGAGVVFKVNKDGTGYTVLKVFDLPDPSYLYGGLHLYQGYLYGIGYNGGTSGYGGVFRIHTDGSGYELLRSFSQSTDGSYPFSPPVISSTGKLYGTTTFGGSSGQGTIYSMDGDGGNFLVIRNLVSGDVQSLQEGVLLASDGMLYGTGFTNSGSAIYRLNTNGSSYAILKSFDASTEGQGGTSLVEVNGVSLPVKLTKFQVQKKNEAVLVTWETAQEENSKSFQIERSADGNTFKAIGIVMARGNANSTSSYAFIDQHPAKGINYYRLRQIDIDEQFSFSPLRSVFFSNEQPILIYPNPANDRIQIILKEKYTTAELEISNSEGKLLKRVSVSNSDKIQLSVESFPPGRYQIRLLANKKLEIASFIKQNK